MKLKGLILAGGEGTRLRPFTLSAPKHLIPLLGKAMIEYPIQHLVDSEVRDIGVVVGYLGHLIEEYLGDNILAHGIERYVKNFLEEQPDVYVMLCRVQDPSRFGVAVLKDKRIVKLVEKPKKFVSDMAMIGVYFFRDPDLVKKAFSTLRPSWRGEYEITELIQWFIDHGYRVEYDVVSGWWKDVGTPEGLLDALYLLLDDIPTRIEGEIRGEVVGRVIIEKGAIVEGSIYGPAYVGDDVVVKSNAVIEHYVSVEARSKILSGVLTRSLVLNDSLIDINKLRLVDTVIGRYCSVTCKRELHGSIKLAISDYSKVNLL